MTIAPAFVALMMRGSTGMAYTFQPVIARSGVAAKPRSYDVAIQRRKL